MVRPRSRASLLGAVLAFAVSTGTWSAAAEPASDPLLARLIKESVDARPEIKREAVAAHGDRERGAEAQAFDDPMLEIGIQNEGFSGIMVGEDPMSYYSFGLKQTLPWWGKRGLKGDVAELSAKQREALAKRLRLSTEAEVRRAYLALILARDRLALLDRLAGTLERVAQIAELRYSAAQGSQTDLLRAKVERSRIEERRIELSRDVRAGQQRINRLRARPLDEPIEPSRRLVDLPLPDAAHPGESLQAARKRSPELMAARLGRQQAERSTELAELGNRPDFTVGAELMYRGTSLPPMWALKVEAPIPVFSWKKTEHASTSFRAEAQASKNSEEEIEQALALSLAERRLLLKTELEQIALYRDRLLPESQTVLESTLNQYSVGQAPFSAVLEVTQALLADEDQYLERRARVEQVLIAEAELSLEPRAGL